MYNLMNMNSLEVNKDDKPINIPIITSTKVIENPFGDLEVRVK